MSFEKIEHIKINKKSGEPIAKNSVKTYVTFLNRLADSGIDTIKMLIDEHTFVLWLIDTLIDGDTDADRALKRQYLSAIFYALEMSTDADRKPYYEAFQKVKQNYGKN